ncbi:MAG: universal stress protein [Salegentibacter sp.]
MKNILIPTDFSSCANHATSIGLEIAKKLKANVTFLHLAWTPAEWSKMPIEREGFFPETKAAIADAKDSLLQLERRAEKSGVQAETNLVFNSNIQELRKYIDEEHYSLVVMGTHGSSGLEKLIGSNTREVINHSPVPVLAVKKQDKPLPFKKVVIASDFKEKSQKGFEKILQIALQLGLETEILFVNVPYSFTETEEIEKMMDFFLLPHQNEQITRKVINARNEERGIQLYMQTNHPSLIATISHGHSGLGNLFRTSITENIINHFDLPVLSIRMKEKS